MRSWTHRFASLLVALAVLSTGCATSGSTGAATSRADVDADADTIPDDRDACREAPEDLDGFEDDDGCPDPDDDDDSVPDATDECPRAPEDLDGFEDEDGCPDPDDDRDRIDDARDACPRNAEVYNGRLDDDGCPDAAIVYVDGDRIVILERIRFSPRTANVLREDRALVDDLVSALDQHPEIERVGLEGRVATGEPDRLRAARARELARRLVSAGIDATRLVTDVPQADSTAAHEDVGAAVELTVLTP